ncbi:MAG TPA: peptidase T [Candidatus Choladousia intestinavium]|uniref:Peptidase T n=1 Tax=Candidatus Choladousia intestinavium TaxID=2840727 RepID=A0A9D1D8E1_9FIRM|nr:peptidase T [Candidatus Choladousia intestinavium]
MRAYERFLRYAAVYTASDEESTAVPTTARQFDLARMLVQELREMGVKDARVDDKCYVYGSIPATPGYEGCVSLGFIAHMDTTPDFKGEGVKPQVIPDYDGEDVALGDSGRVLSAEQFPHLRGLKGRTLITTDGTTLLGADDKAGVAEIMTLAERILNEEIPHGKICIGFTPDEEVGSGADYFDVEHFGAQYAYTLDGGVEAEVVYENFNACSASFEVHGVNIHPGDAKDKMVNASLVAMEINQMLPSCDTPAHTEMYEGFFHLTSMEGNVEKAKLHYIVRDHDRESFQVRKKLLRFIEKTINEKYGKGTAVLQIQDEYENMEEKIKPCLHLIDNAKDAMRELGIEPDVSPVRGGTDGARLSFMGLPCPNLGTGGYAFHGPYEHITAEGMDTVVEIVLGIIRRYAKA